MEVAPLKVQAGGMITSKLTRRAAALFIAPALILGAAGTAGAATDLDPSLPDYPRIRGGAVSFDTGEGRIVCMGSAVQDRLTCQNLAKNWGGKNKKKYNIVQFDLDDRNGTKESGNYDSQNTKLKRLSKGQKYEYDGIVVQGKGGRLYFSSPDHGTRGWVSTKGWKIQKAD